MGGLENPSSPPEPPVQRQRTDGPPALIQAAAGLLHRVAPQLAATGRVLIAEQQVAQAEHRLHALRVLLDVPLQLLTTRGRSGEPGSWGRGGKEEARRFPLTCCSASLFWISWWWQTL